MDFIGASTPLSQAGFYAAANSIGIQAAELWAVISVETSGCGFLADRRPPILFERHLFYRATNAKFPVNDINSPKAGGYAGGFAEFDRLARAIALDRAAALRSASWGIGQILGQNHKAAGYSDVESMVAGMVESEDAQLLAVCRFLAANRLDAALREHDWAGFARGYNGPQYTKFSYDTKLLQNYRKFAAGSLPDLTLREAQMILTFLGHNPGTVDGYNGARTESAVVEFQNAQGLPPNGTVDGATIQALRDALAKTKVPGTATS